MAEEQTGNLMEATESLVEWVSTMKKKYRLTEPTIMDLFRIQLMYIEQQAQAASQPTGQEMVDAIGREADEVITGDE